MRFILLALVLFATAVRAAHEPWTHDWVEVRSQHFLILSAVSPSFAERLARDLENFRRATALLTNIDEFDERVPTRIFLLDHREEEFGLESEIAGFFAPGMRANHAVLLSSGADTAVILKHEYVHFLIHNRDDRLYPTWYSEGFADLLSTLRVRDRTIEYGDTLPARVSWLDNGAWIPFDRLLATRDAFDLSRNQTAMFYAQSWFLMHYLMLGREGADFGAQFQEYLRLVESGVPDVKAFERSFGIAPTDLRGVLLRYARQLRGIRLTLRQAYPAVAIATRTLARDEIATELGQLVLQHRGHEAAARYFAAALQFNPASARALAGTGEVHKFAGDFAAAQPYFERALALDPGEANLELDFAEYFLDRARKESEPDAARKFLIEARRHFARSHKLDGSNPETLAMNGASYLFPGEDAGKGVKSLQAAATLLPSNMNIRGLLAQAYIAAGEYEAARAELRTLAAWSHEEASALIKELLGELERASGEAGRGVTGESPQAE